MMSNNVDSSYHFKCLNEAPGILKENGMSPTYISKLAAKFKIFLNENKIDRPSYSYNQIEEFCLWLIDNVYMSSMASGWRVYKNAFKHICEFEKLNRYIDDAPLYAQGKPVVNKPVENNTKRYVDDYDKQMVFQALRNSNSKYREILVDWVDSSIATGLRPNEWISANILYPDGITPVLKVKNTVKSFQSKDTLPEFRYILLSHLDEHEILQIQRLISSFAFLINDSGYEKSFSRLRSALFKYNEKSLLRTPDKRTGFSIYSCRDQFCLNLRVSVDDPELIAYLMGHSDLERHKRSYGNISHGKKVAFPRNAKDFLVEHGLYRPVL